MSIRDLVIALSLSMAASAALAFPDKPVRLVVPYPVGGATDGSARILAERLSQAWGQPVIVENRPGASTMIASEAVARASPDGCTLLLAVSNHASNPALFDRVPYDTRKDFTPISMVGSAPLVLVVSPKLPVNSTAELLALMRQQPGKLSYGSAGNGSVGHLAGEMFKRMAGVDMVHVPYKGTAPAETDLMAGVLDLMFTGMVTAVPQVNAGRMRGIAVGGLVRSKVLPALPTLDEAGVTGFQAGIWYGVLGPAALPGEIVARIHQDVVTVLKDADVRARLLSQGAESIGNAPEAFRRQIDEEITVVERLVKAAGIRSE